jgi:xanthine dehydrogenase accessory factor
MNLADPILGPLQFIADGDADCALAIIIATVGPSYRSAGSVMAIARDGRTSGSLSSGCIEADIAVHAKLALNDNFSKTIKYGKGSPIMDLRLPCGGAIEVLIVPRPNKQVIRDALAGIENRIPQTLQVNKTGGLITLGRSASIACEADYFHIALQPGIAFHIFGGGEEALHFAKLTTSLQFATQCYSPEMSLAAKLGEFGVPVRLLKSPESKPESISAPRLDRWSAAVLFFHDHDWEPPILQQLLDSDAFYIGAQGSHLARADRDRALAAMGVAENKIARIAGPIGLIPSTRDPRSLAVSVLAEVLAKARLPAQECSH